MLEVKIFTLYPELFPGPLDIGIFKKAKENKIWNLKIINIIFSSNILPENGLLVIEHPKRYHFNQIKFFDQSRFYGNNTFSFFKKRQAYKPDSV